MKIRITARRPQKETTDEIEFDTDVDEITIAINGNDQTLSAAASVADNATPDEPVQPEDQIEIIVEQPVVEENQISSNVDHFVEDCDRLVCDHDGATYQIVGNVGTINVAQGARGITIIGSETGRASCVEFPLPHVVWPTQFNANRFAQQITIDNLFISSSVGNAAVFLRGRGLRINNCRIIHPAYAIWSACEVSGVPRGLLNEDITITNSVMHSTGLTNDPTTAVRMLEFDGLTFTGNDVRSDWLNKQAFRLHNLAHNAVVRSNVFRRTGIAFATIGGDQVHNVVFSDNQIVDFAGSDLWHPQSPGLHNLLAENNHFEIRSDAMNTWNALESRRDPEWIIRNNSCAWLDPNGNVINSWSGNSSP